ncbi:saccharopine dehydrogenase family protein [Patulibacter sp. S7RM1-6]
MTDDRPYDLVLLGCTGFTGGLTAEYLAQHAPADLRWALAGRSRPKLEALRDRLRDLADRPGEIDLLEADLTDRSSLDRVAGQAKVLVTTVGPYALHGEPVVAACAAAGTDYVDLTGEPEFVDRMWNRHHETAVRTGARLVHCAGFDSIPHDLGAYFTVQQLPEGVPLTVQGYVRAGGAVSGGTYHSAVNAFGRARQTVREAKARRAREPRPDGRRVYGIKRAVHRDAAQGGWVVPLPTIDPQIVLRSARALERYGPDFSYGHYMVAKRATTVGLLGAGLGAIGLLAQAKPTRDLLLKLKDQGDGPTPAQRAKHWFRVRFVGEGGGERVVTQVSGGDPGYDETARMLGESALCLALDDLPATAGQVTTAQAMGDALLGRLQRAGLKFEVLEPAR